VRSTEGEGDRDGTLSAFPRQADPAGRQHADSAPCLPTTLTLVRFAPSTSPAERERFFLPQTYATMAGTG
jgi:hypothetical protein